MLLVAQGALLVGTQVWRTTVHVTDSHVVDTVMSIALVAAPLLVVAGIVSMIELEVALTLSAWFEWWRQKRAEENFQAGLEEGIAKGRLEGIAIGRRLQREAPRGETAVKAESNGDGRPPEALKQVTNRNPYV